MPFPYAVCNYRFILLILLFLLISWQLFQGFTKEVIPVPTATNSIRPETRPSITQEIRTKEERNGIPSFRHIIHNSTSVSLIVAGDWGGSGRKPYTTQIQKLVAIAMGQVASEENVSAIFTPGDVMYELGAARNYHTRFKMTFEDVYTHPALYIPWYIVAGNHDYDHDIGPLMHYTKISKRWVFPSSHYIVSMDITSPDSQRFNATFIMIDTMTLCGAMGWKPFNSDDAKRVWDWIHYTLKKDRSTYLFVVGHYPTLSIGLHGPTPCLRRLIQLLTRFKASAYFSGHDHNLQHITTSSQTSPSWTLHHLVVGAGAKKCAKRYHTKQIPPSALKFFYGPPQEGWKNGGFGKLKLTKDKGIFSFINSGKRILHNVTFLPRTRS